jgi:Uma2 family endonuclease
MTTRTKATAADLYAVPDNVKAELVNGELVLMSPTGAVPGRAAGRIYRSLDDYERQTGRGYAFLDNVGFLVSLPNRSSFSPDAAFYVGTLPTGGQFVAGAPLFAAEVRSENDHGSAAEQAIAEKRAEYFAAGTQVVWDVDVLRDIEIRSYHASDPDHPVVFRRGDIANAGTALPGWSLPVDDLLPQQ